MHKKAKPWRMIRGWLALWTSQILIVIHQEPVTLMFYFRCDIVSTFPYGLAVRIPGFHPGGPGSTPGMGRKCVLSFFFETIWLHCSRISVICFNVRYWAKTGCLIFRETFSLLLLFVSSYFTPTTDTLINRSECQERNVTAYFKLFLNFEDMVAVNRHLLSNVMAVILMQR